MAYNFIETDDLFQTILDLNNIDVKSLNKEYDFSCNDEVFLNFKNELLKYADRRFLIVGDYDCDGICATTIIKKLLNYLNIKSNHYIPSRIKEGYGLNDNIVRMAKENNFDCLIMVDNGIVAKKSLKLANDFGLKVFIIDHHEYETLPQDATIIHSNIVEEKFSNLSAGGLAYILSALFYEDDLSLVLGGLSTISDMMSVIGFNRCLIKKAMSKIDDIEQLKMLNDFKQIQYEDISFTIVPKINCVSRMEPQGNPNYFVKFFLDIEFAKKLIETINYLNNGRKQLTKYMSQSVYGDILKEDNFILSISNDYKEGLCGLVANRILHEFNKPVIIMSLTNDNLLKGSGRAPEGVNLFELLKPFEKFDTYGGHETAVGLSLKYENYIEFKEFIKAIPSFEEIRNDVIKIHETDLNNDFLDLLDSLKPFGTGFKEPLFAFDNNGYKKFIISNRFAKYTISNNVSAISFDENYKYFNPNVFIGHLKKDTYKKGNLSFLIDEMI